MTPPVNDTHPAAGQTSRRLTGLWRDSDFMKLWVGQTISLLGSHITGSGLPLAALLVLSATPAQMGVLAAVGSFPVLVVGLVAGVWVDRLRRRPIMITTDLLRALLLLTVPLAAFSGRLGMPQLYVVAALAGVLAVFFDVAYQAYLPTLVERARVLEGNARLTLSSSAAEIIGPGLAGMLVQALTVPVAILFDSLSFLVSVGSLALIRKPEPPPAPAEERRHALAEARVGLAWVAGQPLLRAFAASAALRSFFGNYFAALYGLYAIRVLGLGPAALGVTIGAGGAGSIVGALLAERLSGRVRLGPLLIGSLIFSNIMGFFIPLARGPALLAMACLIVGQFFGDSAGTLYAINEVSLRQAITPDRVLGRVNASMQLLQVGVAPLGALVGGLLATMIGVRPTVWLAVAGQLLGLLPLLMSPVKTLRGMPAAAKPAAGAAVVLE
jgi:predicted MFS family arabinose efflux permease